jgi:hypothetical protein
MTQESCGTRSLPSHWYFIFIAMLCLVASPASAQITNFPNLGHIGPSNAEVAGAIIGAAAVVAVVVYLAIPKQTTIEGCAETVNGLSRITSEKDKRIYELVIGDLPIKEGERFKLKGKKHKDKSGQRQFTVKKIVADLGVCQSEPARAE